MKRVFICSPYAGNTIENEALAKRLCRMAVAQGHAPFAPHLLFTRFLDDGDPSARETGLACGMAFLEACDEVWVYAGLGVSEGMKTEVARARELALPIVVMLDLKADPCDRQSNVTTCREDTGRMRKSKS